MTASVRRAGSAPPGTREVIVGDLNADTDWEEALTGQEYVVHLAARVHVMSDTSSDPLEAFREANTSGTLRLAEQAIGAGVARIIYVSSIKAQGEARSLPYSVGDPASPTDAYGISKLLAEEGLRTLEHKFALGIVILRPPLVYGEGVGGNLLRLMRIIERGVPLPFASVRNERAMISVENFANIIGLCISPDVESAESVLVADSETLSTADIVRELAMGLGRKPRLFPFPPRLLVLAGTLCGMSAELERLIGNLRVDSNISQLSPDYEEQVAARIALRDTARAFAVHQTARFGK